jgi:uncharacterized protein YdaU (DUF1376 family)
MSRRICITGVRRREIDADLLAFVYFQEGKRIARERRERALQEKREQQEKAKAKRQQDREVRHER